MSDKIISEVLAEMEKVLPMLGWKLDEKDRNVVKTHLTHEIIKIEKKAARVEVNNYFQNKNLEMKQ